MAAAENGSIQPQSALIFLGTGCSSAVPNALCLIRPSDPPCTVCSQSLTVPPEENRNYRCNTSLLIDYCKDNGAHKYIIFREQVLRWFSHYRIPQVDSNFFNDKGPATAVPHLGFLYTRYATDGSHKVHLCLTQTLEALKMLCPKRALLIGMTHEFDHHKDNEFLEEWSRREGIAVQLAHDGLRVPFNL
ncbi:hypothetical protein K7X08_006888 [Anisodus acutangulus]|uniref:Uncharacterized protein n=1 Tax=Anisodus acutangulus TaxID=402998 RepID=A0A9Q1LEB8_9SOLA|nr:hypothetical protein K7X08_006888 [Anisodus acutangulus]